MLAVVAVMSSISPAFGQSADQEASQTTTEDQDEAANTRSAIISGRTGSSGSGTDIIVTGTRIQRPNNKSAAPIVTVTANDIQAQGATTIEEVLNRLPQVQQNSEQNFSDSTGRQRIKLRTLGYERTLSLIDGLRFGLPNTIDVGIIPNSLVERIDVLSGGASSVYGSDAVAGVVNFILKKNFEGIRADAQYSFFNHNNRENAITDAARRANLSVPLGMTNDGGRSDVSVAAGVNLFDKRVNITGFVNYRHSDFLRIGDRSHAVCEVTQPTNTSPLSCNPSTFLAAGVIIPRTGPRANQTLVNDPSGSGRLVPYGSVPGTSGSPYDDWAFQREFNRINVGGFLTAKLAEDMELYGNGLYYRDRSSSPILNRFLASVQLAPGTPYQIGCNNPFLSASQAADLGCPSLGSSTIVPLDVRYRFDGIGPLQIRSVNQQYRFVAGIRGRTEDGIWSYDLAGMLSQGKINTNFGTPVSDRLRNERSIDVVSVNGVPTCRSVVNGTDPSCIPFNPFIPYNNNRAAYDYIYGNTAAPNQVTDSRMRQVVGTISGDLTNFGIKSPWADQGVAVALGIEYRDELLDVNGNDTFNAQQQSTNGRFTQNILESNIEVQLPIADQRPWADQLQINGGYRISRYNRLEGYFNTWKVEGIWGPIRDITFRGSINRAQRAPDVGSAQGAANIFFNQGFYNDPCASRVNPANTGGPRLAPEATLAQCRNTGLPDNLYGSDTLDCAGACTVRNGGFNLVPETAYTKTFGVVLRPSFVPGLTISIDRFLIDLQDQLIFLQPQNLIEQCLRTGNDFFCRGIVRNPGTFTLNSAPEGEPAAGWVVRGSSNGFKEQSYGWDFQGQYNLGLGSAGRLDFGFNGTLTTRVGAQEAPTVTPRNCVGYYGRTCGESLPRWAHQLRTTWSSPDRVASVSVNWRHRGPMPLDVYAPTDTGIPAASPNARRDQYPQIGSFNWFDLGFTFDVSKQMTFRLTANNILDRDPPIVPDSRSVIGLLRSNSIMGYDLLGRQIVASVSLRM
ncbi:TonB-dependent receptor plug domain-containing protein [Sphingomonas carotinifaciens]|uniref:TonB-dependent receptor plug domain-containing protein n=1 Tax=Sphingomonas carotinifaciens TaxID=1166323 RepID=UPI00288932AD|nr:TonB-dependent receptor plug domain-containing protein [Sphingomonas carotinifaciens]